MLRRHAAGFRAALITVDALLAVVVLVLTSALRFGADWADHWDPILPNPGLVVGGYAIGWTVVLAYNGLYRPRARWTIRGEARDIGRSALIMAALTLAALFWTRQSDVSRTFLLLLFPVQALVTLSTRVLLRAWFRRLRAGGYNRRFVLVVGAGPRGQAFAAKLEDHRELGLKILGFVDDEASELPRGWRHLGPLEGIEGLLHSEVIDEVALCLPMSLWHRTSAIAHLCEEEGKIVRVPVDMLDRSFAAARVEELDGTPVYSLVSGPDRIAALVAKRALDVVVATAALIVLSPVLVLVVLAIRSQEGPPVLFRQVRVGLHGRRFVALKFRTMAIDAEERYAELVDLGDPRAFKLTDDPRVTSIGRFLRRTSLDELPQLWNVIRGEMSLVGPRPAPPREVEGYDLWHRRRLSMKPGITGLWQVTARRSDDFDERAELDLTYIDDWSLWLDLRILARTIPAAFVGR